MTHPPGSDDLDGHAPGVRRERSEVSLVTGEDDASGLRHRDDYRVNGRTTSRPASQLSRSTSSRVAHGGLDDARLHESVDVRVPAGVSLKGLHEHDGRHDRRPQVGDDEALDECQRLGVPCSQPGNAAAVEDQHLRPLDRGFDP